MNIQRHEIQQLTNNENEFALILHLDEGLAEFANELGEEREQQNLKATALKIMRRTYPNLRVSVIKVVVGGMLVASLPLVMNNDSASAQTTSGVTQVSQSSTIFYYVKAGDSLWTISRAFNTSIDQLKRANRLTSDTLKLNQRLIIPKAFHTVGVGDYLTVLARDYQSSVEAIKEANQLTSDQVQLGQVVVIPMVPGTPNVRKETTSPSTTKEITTYTVVSGDSVSVIAKQFNTTADAIRNVNNLTSDVIFVGQTLLIPTVASTSPQIQIIDSVYTVVSGDSLSHIAKRFGTTTEALRLANGLKTDMLQIGQRLVIPNGNTNLTPPTTPTLDTTTNTYTVVSGDSLFSIANRFGTTVATLRTVNQLSSDTLQIGQALVVPSNNSDANESEQTIDRVTFTYKVQPGDSLSVIANRFNVTVEAIRLANHLRTDMIQVGQSLTIPDGLNAPTQTSGNTVSNITYTVVSGDNIWDLSVRFGIPQAELLRANQLTTSSRLTIGQKLIIPVHTIAVKPVVSERHGELLDWWAEAQYVFPIGKTATVTDFITGQSFKIKRTIGANHADSETLTVTDTNIARSIWGGFSWTPRAVIVEVDGRKLAASMSFMPHDIEYITNNGITGHFDVYFSNSTRHVDGKRDASHQAQLERAAGLS
ncbi:muramidase family protein [Bacillus suaedae]|uniref:LysM peptidoglycan-binding domain-containing protein n=1 Tax=Halalkalibacter suaedae TaxID=2822140 RepID=A0A940X0T1_9BACI|nr:LysM peptidoglycan-binding domain-containing protein [Bacillus suaedae]MBP3953211.1 LysM peptidoglycan-binding domain-containing protein [Bacillus suaedae]